LKSSFQAVGQDLLDNEAVLEAVNQEALDLLQELRQGEGLVDMLGFEEQLRLVNETWNEAKFQVQIEYHFGPFLGYPILISVKHCFFFSAHVSVFRSKNTSHGIDLIMVFDAILTGRQSGQKLKCLYGNLMANISLQN